MAVFKGWTLSEHAASGSGAAGFDPPAKQSGANLPATPAPDATLDDLFAAIDWVAPGFEVVQSHLPDWKFLPADTVADGGLHARLLVGARCSVREVAPDATYPAGY